MAEQSGHRTGADTTAADGTTDSLISDDHNRTTGTSSSSSSTTAAGSEEASGRSDRWPSLLNEDQRFPSGYLFNDCFDHLILPVSNVADQDLFVGLHDCDLPVIMNGGPHVTDIELRVVHESFEINDADEMAVADLLLQEVDHSHDHVYDDTLLAHGHDADAAGRAEKTAHKTMTTLKPPAFSYNAGTTTSTPSPKSPSSGQTSAQNPTDDSSSHVSCHSHPVRDSGPEEAVSDPASPSPLVVVTEQPAAAATTPSAKRKHQQRNRRRSLSPARSVSTTASVPTITAPAVVQRNTSKRFHQLQQQLQQSDQPSVTSFSHHNGMQHNGTAASGNFNHAVTGPWTQAQSSGITNVSPFPSRSRNFSPATKSVFQWPQHQQQQPDGQMRWSRPSDEITMASPMAAPVPPVDRYSNFASSSPSPQQQQSQFRFNGFPAGLGASLSTHTLADQTAPNNFWANGSWSVPQQTNDSWYPNAPVANGPNPMVPYFAQQMGPSADNVYNPTQPRPWNPGMQMTTERRTFAPVAQSMPCSCPECEEKMRSSAQRPPPPPHQHPQSSSSYYFPGPSAMATATPQSPAFMSNGQSFMPPVQAVAQPLFQNIHMTSESRNGNRMFQQQPMSDCNRSTPEKKPSIAKLPPFRSLRPVAAPPIPEFVTIPSVPEPPVADSASVSTPAYPTFEVSPIEPEPEMNRSPVRLDAKQNYVNEWLATVMPWETLRQWQTRPPIPDISQYELQYVCPKGCDGFQLPCLQQQQQQQPKQEQQQQEFHFAKPQKREPQVTDQMLPMKAENADQKALIPHWNTTQVRTTPAVCAAVTSNSLNIPCPNVTVQPMSHSSGRHNMPMLPVEGIVSNPKRVQTSEREGYSRPRPFELESLTIGRFHIQNQVMEPKRYLTKVKVVPAKKRIIYEFVVAGTTADPANATADSVTITYALMVPFAIISGLNAVREARAVYLTVDHRPLLFSSEGSNRSVVFDETTKADPTSGELEHFRLHKIQLKSAQQVDRFVTSLFDFHPPLREVASTRLTMDPACYRCAEPLPQVDDA